MTQVRTATIDICTLEYAAQATRLLLNDPQEKIPRATLSHGVHGQSL